MYSSGLHAEHHDWDLEASDHFQHSSFVASPIMDGIQGIKFQFSPNGTRRPVDDTTRTMD